MLNEDDAAQLQTALDWARQKGPKDEQRDFVFSGVVSACKASQRLLEAVDGIEVTCHGQVVTVTRPRDPVMLKNVKDIFALNQ